MRSDDFVKRILSHMEDCANGEGAFSEEKRTYYEAEKYYHMYRGTQTLCGREVNRQEGNDGSTDGKWVFDANKIQAQCAPCPQCVTARMRED